MGTSTIYQDAVVKLRNCFMDPEQESRYIKELLNMDKEIQDVSGSFSNTKHIIKMISFHLNNAGICSVCFCFVNTQTNPYYILINRGIKKNRQLLCS